MKRVKILFFTVILKVFLAGFYGLVFAYPVQLLWNALMTELFSISPLSFLQSWGLIILIRLLIDPSTSDPLCRAMIRRFKTPPSRKKDKDWKKEFFSGLSDK